MRFQSRLRFAVQHRSWAFCDGQLLAVSQNDALFSLLGTIYGGDGRTTFGLPDLRGRIPIHAGSGPGLSTRRLGEKGGAESVTLTLNQLPSHTHNIVATSNQGTERNPAGNIMARSSGDLYREGTPNGVMAITTVTNVGGSQSLTNLMPTLCVNFIIALFGIYPSRS